MDRASFLSNKRYFGEYFRNQKKNTFVNHQQKAIYLNCGEPFFNLSVTACLRFVKYKVIQARAVAENSYIFSSLNKRLRTVVVRDLVKSLTKSKVTIMYIPIHIVQKIGNDTQSYTSKIFGIFV